MCLAASHYLTFTLWASTLMTSATTFDLRDKYLSLPGTYFTEADPDTDKYTDTDRYKNTDRYTDTGVEFGPTELTPLREYLTGRLAELEHKLHRNQYGEFLHGDAF